MARAGIEQPISRYIPAARPIGHCCVFATWVRFAKMDRCCHAAPEKRMTRSTMRVASALQKARSGDPSRRHAQFWMMLETYKIRVTRVKSRILTATPSPRRTRSRPVAAICPLLGGIARSAAHVATIAGTRPAATRRPGAWRANTAWISCLRPIVVGGGKRRNRYDCGPS